MMGMIKRHDLATQIFKGRDAGLGTIFGEKTAQQKVEPFESLSLLCVADSSHKSASLPLHPAYLFAFAIISCKLQ